MFIGCPALLDSRCSGPAQCTRRERRRLMLVKPFCIERMISVVAGALCLRRAG